MKIIYLISKWSGYFSTGVLGLMMMLTVIDVFMRFAFNSPITATAEFTGLLMVMLVFPLYAWGAIANRHVSVEMFFFQLSKTGQKVIRSVTLLLTLGTFALITYLSAIESMDTNMTSAITEISLKPFMWILTYGFGLFCLSIIFRLIVTITGKEVKK